ncbi:MAG: hypothetical protein AB1781_03035 [Pseudomonadota bacterium]
MLTLSSRHQLLIGFGLIALIAATRGHHFATLEALPGASWAAFFLAGIYLRPILVLPGLLVLTWLLDFAAFTWGGASGFCLTPAYAFLLPAYGSLWLAGRWYAHQHRFEWRTIAPLCLSALVGASACELFSSGGFYFFSGRFADPTFAEFGTRVLQYFPGYLQSLAFYIGIAAAIHTAFNFARGTSGYDNATAG